MMIVSKYSSLILGLLAMLCASCSPTVTPKDRIGHYNFVYDTEGEAKIKLIQVFDDGIDMYLQFVSERDLRGVKVLGNDGKNLPAGVTGNMIIVKGIHNILNLKKGWRKAQVTRKEQQEETLVTTSQEEVFDFEEILSKKRKSEH